MPTICSILGRCAGTAPRFVRRLAALADRRSGSVASAAASVSASICWTSSRPSSSWLIGRLSARRPKRRHSRRLDLHRHELPHRCRRRLRPRLASPGEELRRSKTMAARHVADCPDARAALGHNLRLVLGRPPAARTRSGEHLDPVSIDPSCDIVTWHRHGTMSARQKRRAASRLPSAGATWGYDSACVFAALAYEGIRPFWMKSAILFTVESRLPSGHGLSLRYCL